MRVENMAANVERLDIRLDPPAKNMIRQAAAYTGQTISEFIKSVAVRKAKSVVREHQLTLLSERDWKKFLSLIDSDAKPNAALAKAAREYNASGQAQARRA